MKTGIDERLKADVIQKALDLGFDDVGFCSALPFDEWRAVAYEEVRRRISHDPRAVLPDANSIVVAVRRYDVFDAWPDGTAPVANYYVNSTVGFERIKGVAAVLEDAGYHAAANPLLPAKQAALRAGLGMQGMNTQFSHGRFGMLVSLHLVLTDALLADRDAPRRECFHCGRCAAACPSGAIMEGGFDHNRCLRHLMASGDVMPLWARDLMGLRLTGCTDCQHACPRAEVRMAEVPAALARACDIEGLLRGEAAQYEALAAYIGVNFARKKRIQAQAAVSAGNSGDRRYVSALATLLHGDGEALRSHAAWALGKLGGEEARSALEQALPEEADEGVKREIAFALGMLA